MRCGVRDDAPAEAALDRADVRDAAHVAVDHLLLPARQPLEHRVEHRAHPQDRVLVAPALAERRVDERPVRGEPQPQRAEVREHELVLRRLAEDAHVGDAAVRDEVARAGRVAAVLGALRVALLRLLDLAGDRGDQHVAAQPHARVLQRAHGLDVARDRALHVRDAEPVDAAVALEPLAAGSPGCPAATARARSTTCRDAR